MVKKESKTVIKVTPAGIIEDMIYIVRGQKVMLDSDLSQLYGVKTKSLNLAVKRNIDRFPHDFMFQLTKEEFANLRFQFETSSWGGIRYLPFVFTEQGVAMLSSVLNSKRAIQVNIAIMRTFIKLRRMILTHKEMRRKIEEMEKRYDKQFKVVFTALKELLDHSKEPQKPRARIGFHPDK
ncbi:MAG: ORF6N domain-containing protein [Candidatus Omnitrophica bacterium]|nr:ORF6N domain-containing protein [Candidatus Omnitrophota bacterium]HOX53849.1 ORF6N domain-containing protein [Candidatus Omnitrophota bacterium]